MKKLTLLILALVFSFNYSSAKEALSEAEKNVITAGLKSTLSQRKKQSEKLNLAIDFLKSSTTSNVLQHIIKYEDAYNVATGIIALSGLATAAVTAHIDYENLVYLSEAHKNFKYTKISGGVVGLAISALIYINTSDRLEVYRDLDNVLGQMSDEEIETFVKTTFSTKAEIDAQVLIIENTLNCVNKSKLVSDLETCLY